MSAIVKEAVKKERHLGNTPVMVVQIGSHLWGDYTSESDLDFGVVSIPDEVSIFSAPVRKHEVVVNDVTCEFQCINAREFLLNLYSAGEYHMQWVMADGRYRFLLTNAGYPLLNPKWYNNKYVHDLEQHAETLLRQACGTRGVMSKRLKAARLAGRAISILSRIGRGEPFALGYQFDWGERLRDCRIALARGHEDGFVEEQMERVLDAIDVEWQSYKKNKPSVNYGDGLYMKDVDWVYNQMRGNMASTVRQIDNYLAGTLDNVG